VIAKAARQLGIDQVEIRKINAPAGKAKFGPGECAGQQGVSDQLLHQRGALIRERRSSSGMTQSPQRTAPGLEGAWQWRGNQLV